jgi:hypothetical protein
MRNSFTEELFYRGTLVQIKGGERKFELNLLIWIGIEDNGFMS